MIRFMSQGNIKGFALIGILVCAGIAAIGLYGLFYRIKERIIFRRKCYCIQCEYWETSDIDRNTAPCRIWDKWTSKDESCTRGRLRTERGYEDEKWRINEQKEWEEKHPDEKIRVGQ